MAGCIGYLIILVVSVFASPIVGFFCGYIAGSILEWTVGGMIVDGLNILFNTTRFNADMLPVICGALAVIGSFFKGSFSYKEK